MPGRAKLKRALIATVAIAAATIGSGCASADHTWTGELDARLDGAATVVEEAREAAHPQMSPVEYFETVRPLGESLFFKSQLIAKLEPPPRCEAVQVKGKAAVYLDSELLGSLPMNLTPELERHLPALLEEEVAKLERIEREAGTCA